MFSDVLIQKRKELGFTQQKIAELSEISLPTIQNIENGRANPSLEVILRISKVLGLEMTFQSQMPDWNRLASFAIPLSNNKSRSNATVDVASAMLELRKAVVFCLEQKNDRQAEALAATILALKSYWPSVYKTFGPFREKMEMLLQRQDVGKLLKLRPLAADRLRRFF
jgi:transcriptional regulator with XRE-family HTH domain